MFNAPLFLAALAGKAIIAYFLNTDSEDNNILEKEMNNLLITNFKEFQTHDDNSRVSVLYHYTKTESFFKMLKNVYVNKKLTFWITNCQYLNDPEEMNVNIEEILERHYSKDLVGKMINTNLNEIFVLAFSKHNDSLPMWNMYAQQCSGLSLGFDRKMLESIFANCDKHKFGPCIYLTESENCKNLLDQIILTTINQIKGNKDKYPCLNKVIQQSKKGDYAESDLIRTIAYSVFENHIYGKIKNKSYEYEGEFRAKVDISEKNDKLVKYRYNNGLIIPYIEYPIPVNCLTEITIGPINDQERVKKSLRAYLDSIGLNYIKLDCSNVRYRL